MEIAGFGSRGIYSPDEFLQMGRAPDGRPSGTWSALNTCRADDSSVVGHAASGVDLVGEWVDLTAEVLTGSTPPRICLDRRPSARFERCALVERERFSSS